MVHETDQIWQTVDDIRDEESPGTRCKDGEVDANESVRFVVSGSDCASNADEIVRGDHVGVLCGEGDSVVMC